VLSRLARRPLPTFGLGHWEKPYPTAEGLVMLAIRSGISRMRSGHPRFDAILFPSMN